MIGATYGDDLASTISLNGETFQGKDISSTVNFKKYVKSQSIPIDLYAFSFELPFDVNNIKITVHDKSQKVASVITSISECVNHNILVKHNAGIVFAEIDNDPTINQEEQSSNNAESLIW